MTRILRCEADFAAVSEEGLIFLSHSRVTDVYTLEGELVLSLPQQWSSMEWKGTGLEECGVDTATGRALVFVEPRFFRPAEVELLLGDAPGPEKNWAGRRATIWPRWCMK